MAFPANMSVSMERMAKELCVKPEYVVEQFVRGSGMVGRKGNKTSSAVMLTHIPTKLSGRGVAHRSHALYRR